MSDVDDTTLEAGEAADAAEWDAANDKFDSDKGIKTEERKEEPAKKTEDEVVLDEAAQKRVDAELARVEAEAEARKNETPEQKAEREKKEAEEAAANKETEEQAAARRDRESAARDARSLQRDILAETEAMQNDIVDTMFKDKDGKLYDADGDEIRTIDDVMALRNPNTGKNFTEDEAGAYLLKATQHAQQEREDAIAMAKTYAEVNLTIKDEADTIKDKYGEFLNDPKNAALKAEIWADYEATLQTDEESGVIVKAPVSMVRFYDRALKPYVEAQSTINNAEQAKKEAEAAAAKAAEDAKRARTRSDREDLFDRGNSGRETLSKDEAEWADAEKAYYGRK